MEADTAMDKVGWGQVTGKPTPSNHGQWGSGVEKKTFFYLPCKLTMTFSHLKMDRWKMSSSLLGRFGLFSGAMSVSERVFQKPI